VYKILYILKIINEISPVFIVCVIDDKDLFVEIMCDRANTAKKNYKMAKELNLRIIAKGVENKEQVDFFVES